MPAQPFPENFAAALTRLEYRTVHRRDPGRRRCPTTPSRFGARRPDASAFAGAWATILLAGLVLGSGCSNDPTGTVSNPVRLVVAEGGMQFVLPGQTATLPLSVQALDAATGRPVKDIEVTWTVTGGSGAVLLPGSASTDGVGIAGVQARVGSALGTYRFEATTKKLAGEPAAFELRAVRMPVISAVSPTTATGGQTIEVTGTDFSGNAAEHGILFGGLSGTVLSATPTRITARVPPCVLDRTTDVRITLGSLSSNSVSIRTVSGAVTTLDLDAGERISITEPASLACLAIGDVPADSRFLLIAGNAARSPAIPMRYVLDAIADAGPAAAITSATGGGHRDAALDFEIRLRTVERSLGPVAGPDAAELKALGVLASPQIGDRRDFNVLADPDGTTRRITATVRAISSHAILYVDEQAPPGGLTSADLEYFGSLFDDPIYTTDTSVFGSPSDIDANGTVIVLFTPAVNGLTEGQGTSFIAGYFYGCDLVTASRCSATNRGEIFYSMVPDPTGRFSAPRSRDVVLGTVPAVLAHEFQHMINFGRKGGHLDVLWLSEGLAHAAEDLVGEAFLDRGDVATAEDFRRSNHTRAQLYLRNTVGTSLVSEDSPGTLEQRGAAWLLVKYIAGHFGGNSLLGRLASSSEFGAANIEESTGQPWMTVLSGFVTALWADEAPGLGGPVAPTSTFVNFDLRTVIGALPGGYPLQPPAVGFHDFQLSGTLPAGSQYYLLLDVPSSSAAIRLGFTGVLGGPFEKATAPQFTILRIR